MKLGNKGIEADNQSCPCFDQYERNLFSGSNIIQFAKIPISIISITGIKSCVKDL